MKAIQECASTVLAWIQPKSLKRRFELRSGDEAVVAMLQWEKTCGSLATAQAADGRWTFKRVGFLNPRVTVRVAGSDADAAVFLPGWKGDGTLVFSDGRSFRWIPLNFWSTKWAFTSANGEHLVRFKPAGGLSGLFKQEAQAEVEPNAISMPDLSLLVLLGWYLMILQSDDAAAIAATTAATAAAAS